MRAPIASPMTASAVAAAQPPRSKPPRVSSSGRAGACMTPSRVTWLTTTSEPIAATLRPARDRGQLEPRDRGHLVPDVGAGALQRVGHVLRVLAALERHVGGDEHLAGPEVDGLQARDSGDAGDLHEA